MSSDTDSDRIAKRKSRLSGLPQLVIQEFYREYWGGTEYDIRLYRAMGAALQMLSASSLAVVDADQRIVLSCVGLASWEKTSPSINLNCSNSTIPDYSRRTKELEISHWIRAQIDSGFLRLVPGEPTVLSGDGVHCDLLIIFSANLGRRKSSDSMIKPSRTYGTNGIAHRKGMYSCVLYHWNGLAKLFKSEIAFLLKEREWIENELRQVIGSGVLPLVLDVFRYYERRFASFPARLREVYWQNIVMRRVGGKITESALMPPWDVCSLTRRTVPTVSLSLDLRKSTYCMEYAASNREFGRWLEMFTEKMRSVAHRHGGIYDKFTGDGSLVHFLERESQEIYGLSAVDAAVHCAADMQRVVERHMAELRRFLQHDSAVFGAGIAIDVNEAYWACDDRDNPVVVGRGVVGACRVGDKAPRQTIRLTNVAFHRLGSDVRDKLPNVQQVLLETKESTGGFSLQCWQFDANRADGLGYGYDAMTKLCKEVYSRFPVDTSDLRQATGI